MSIFKETNLIYVFLIGLSGLGILSGIFVDGLHKQKYEKLDTQISSTGHNIKHSDAYRFAEYKGETLYGPYHVGDKKYFYHNGDILGSNLNESTSESARNLHNFYLENYFDPLFYSPTSYKNQSDLSGFDKYEKNKILTEECGLEYNTIPSDYLKSLGDNMRIPDKFFKHASLDNAEKVIKSNEKTLGEYLNYISAFTDNLNKNLSENECFTEDIDHRNSDFVTRTPSSMTIDRQILINYTSKANKNAIKLSKAIKYRKELVNSSSNYSIQINNHSFVNKSYNYNLSMNSSEALTEFNDRRRNELIKLDSAQNKANLSLTDEMKKDLRLLDKKPRGYEVETYCTVEDTELVYGEQMNIYPNIISGIEDKYEDEDLYLKDFYAACNCPYVEITRLNWYVVDHFKKNIEIGEYSGPLSNKISKSKQNFVKYPGQRSMRQVSKTYDQAVKESLIEGKITEEIPKMWKMSRQQESKLHKFKSAYDDFYNSRHMEIWNDYFSIREGKKYSADDYYSFLLMGSEYSLNFMTWSDSVWRLEEKPRIFSGSTN